MIPRPEVSPWLVAGLCILYYMDPAGLCRLLLIACAVHEAAHLLCAILLHLPVTRFELTLLGARLQVDAPPGRALLLCTLSGPAASLLLGAALPCWPRLGLMSLALGIFNLLPFRALDGGQILLLLCKDHRLFFLCQILFFLLAIAVSLLLSAAGFGLWPMGITSALLLRGCLETAVAKRAENG